MRDSLANLPPGDWDLATAARPEQVRSLFRRTVPIGIEHGTVGVLDEYGVMHEVTTFRRDVETTGRHAVVEFSDDVDEDLARRDFTINAVAWHPVRREVRDPYDGRADLERRVLRTVGDPNERFAEDWLRVLRGLRFAGHFDMRIDEATWRALPAAAPHLPELSGERVREELWKVLAKSPRASAALSLYAASGALAVLYPELDALVGLDAGGGRDAWTVSLMAVDALPTSRPTLRAAALLHAIGMPAARTRDLRGGWRYVGHAAAGARMAEELMKRLRASNADTERVRRLVATQSEWFPPDAAAPAVRKWLRAVGPDLANDMFRLRVALERARAAPAAPGDDLLERWRAVRAVLREHPPLAAGDLAIGGTELRELGLKPGPEYGRILEALLEEVLARPESNRRETLIQIVRERWAE